jgi:DNA recombination protein RmuC
MTWVVVAFSCLILVLLGGLLWMARRPRNDGSLQLIQQQITAMNEQLSRSLQDVSKLTGTELDRFHQRMDQRLSQTGQMVQNTHETVGKRLDQNSELFSQVAQRLTKMEETHKQIQHVGEEVARLQEVLRAPKLRGNLGELFLEELLAQILPTNYFTMQYRFKDGDIVDSVIHLPNSSLVPVDAKFPLENFQRMIQPNLEDTERERYRKAFAVDFKKHVDTKAQKYIRPDEKTLDFALMYVPA